MRIGLEKIVSFIKEKLGKEKITILDSTCGDMNWMPVFLRGRTDVDYTGYDLIPVNIESARARFSNESWEFHTWDLVQNKIGEN